MMHFKAKIQPDSWNRLVSISSALACLLLTVFMYSAQVSAKETDVPGAGGNTYERLKVFSEILSLIESSYVEPVESKALIEGAIRGMVKALDPHTSYLPPEAFREMQVETSGKFGGLGIEISLRNGVLTVISRKASGGKYEVCGSSALTIPRIAPSTRVLLSTGST